ncbi:hypothetical protein KI387_001022 [Taxus chinensis]|uniref:Uncharacterized protein n=1 Tax=Taxus chinensis TaxID=29808 RepID=A0AA38GSK9_TAXCH|nr:hypothetical protein KI387_001022 [Taxus chinensis]
MDPLRYKEREFFNGFHTTMASECFFPYNWLGRNSTRNHMEFVMHSSFLAKGEMLQEGLIIPCTKRFPPVELTLEKHMVSDDFHVVGIEGTNLLFEIQWLHPFGEFTQNYQSRELRFELGGMTSGDPQVGTTKNTEKIIRRRQDLWAALENGFGCLSKSPLLAAAKGVSLSKAISLLIFGLQSVCYELHLLLIYHRLLQFLTNLECDTTLINVLNCFVIVPLEGFIEFIFFPVISFTCQRYEDAKAKGKDNYDREMEDVLERHIGECERKITRALRRLDDDDAKAATAISVSEVTKSPEVEDYTKQIKEKLKEAEYLDLEGRSDDKIRIMEIVEELRAKRADKQAMLLLEAFNKDRASMPQPVQTTPTLAPLPVTIVTDARTQEMIIEKLKKAEEFGKYAYSDNGLGNPNKCSFRSYGYLNLRFFFSFNYFHIGK